MVNGDVETGEPTNLAVTALTGISDKLAANTGVLETALTPAHSEAPISSFLITFGIFSLSNKIVGSIQAFVLKLFPAYKNLFCTSIGMAQALALLFPNQVLL